MVLAKRGSSFEQQRRCMRVSAVAVVMLSGLARPLSTGMRRFQHPSHQRVNMQQTFQHLYWASHIIFGSFSR